MDLSWWLPLPLWGYPSGVKAVSDPLSSVALAAVSLAAVFLADLAALGRKLVLFAYSTLYFVLSCDGDFQLPADPGKSASAVSGRKRIVFVRHGESEWNECFNRAMGPGLPFRLLRALTREALMCFQPDSLFLDSPLSKLGIEQAQMLEHFLESESGEELHRICEAGAVFTSSCLRRATATMLIGFSRFLRGGRPVWALSCLQEISRNMDTLMLAAPHQPPPLDGASSEAWAPAWHSGQGGASACLQAAFNFGNKGLDSNGAQRLQAFCEWVFSDRSPAALQPTVIVSGHSLWFRTFFQMYLPRTTDHGCKYAKIANCSVLAFDLEQLVHPTGGPAESGEQKFTAITGSWIPGNTTLSKGRGFRAPIARTMHASDSDGELSGSQEYRVAADTIELLYGHFEESKKPWLPWRKVKTT